MNQSPSRSLPRRRWRPAMRPLLLATASLGLLAGCGQGEPGAAFTIEGASTSLNEVDRMTGAACEALRPQLEQSGVSRPMAQIRTFAAMLLINGEVARTVAEENGLRPGPEYGALRDYWEKRAADMDPVERADFVEINTLGLLDVDLRTQLGQQILAEQGNAAPNEDEAISAGTEALIEWYAEHDIRIDPRFGLDIVDGTFVPAAPSLGVAVSDFAQTRANAEDLAYVADMPKDQVCG